MKVGKISKIKPTIKVMEALLMTRGIGRETPIRRKTRAKMEAYPGKHSKGS